MEHPPLPPSVRVADDVDPDRAWEVFERFEALHHRMDILNPLSSEGLDAVLEAAAPAAGSRLVDLACGHGELLLRAAAQHGAGGLGVDLSPWALVRAVRQAEARGVADRLAWLLADAGEVAGRADFDTASALGASWVWDGYAGTVVALARHVRPGGTVIVGDLFRRPGVTPAEVEDGFGEVPTPEEQEAAFPAAGVELLTTIDTEPADWEDYQRQIEASVEAWVDANPGERAEGYLADNRHWAADNADAPQLIGWNVRIGRRR